MKRNALALGVAAALGLVGVAHAQVAGPIHIGQATEFKFNPDAVGNTLIQHYGSAANGNATNFSITNTDHVNGKAVKVRVRSAVNSDDLFDFTLLMSPSDMWTGVITTNPATGLASLVTRDKSCTLPDIGGGKYNDFSTRRLPSEMSAAELSDWTREFYIEILTMADIPGPKAGANPRKPNTWGAYESDTSSQDPANIENNWGRLFKAVKHVNGVAPCTPSVLNTANYGQFFSTMAAANKRGLDHPTGSLFGNTTIMNGSTNVVFSDEMSAILATGEDGKKAPANFVFAPQDRVAIAGGADLWTSDPLFRQTHVSGATRVLPAINLGGLQIDITLPRVQAFANDMPDLSTPYVQGPNVNHQDGPLSSVGKLMGQLAVTSIANEFFTGEAYGGGTDWTLSNPLRRYQVAMDYTADALREDLVQAYDGRVYTLPGTITGALGYWPDYWVQYYDPWNTQLDKRRGKRICWGAQGVAQWDREETTVINGFDLSPSIPGGLHFCGEATVLSIGSAAVPTEVLGAKVTVSSMSSPFSEGWAKISTANPATDGYFVPFFGQLPSNPSWNRRDLRGLPILGAAFMKSRGVPAPGVSTNYGMSFKHRVERDATLVPTAGVLRGFSGNSMPASQN